MGVPRGLSCLPGSWAGLGLVSGECGSWTHIREAKIGLRHVLGTRCLLCSIKLPFGEMWVISGEQVADGWQVSRMSEK